MSDYLNNKENYKGSKKGKKAKKNYSSQKTIKNYNCGSCSS